jgi:hypothetical protein
VTGPDADLARRLAEQGDQPDPIPGTVPPAPPVYDRHGVTVLAGDCLDRLAELDDASVDAVVSDPPYGLEFMGKDWDSFRPSSARIRTRDDQRTNPTTGTSTTSVPEAYVAGLPFQRWCAQWAAECLRVLKPGGYLVAFSGTRTYHRLASGVEDAGFEIRDRIDCRMGPVTAPAWWYGQGFPKSLDVAKAIDQQRDDRSDIRHVTTWLAEQRDRAGWTNRRIDDAFGFNGMAGHWTAGPELKIAQVPRWDQWCHLRELIGFGDEMDAAVWRLNGRKGTPGNEHPDRVVAAPGANAVFQPTQRVLQPGTPVLDAARQWEGWGTALKPAH